MGLVEAYESTIGLTAGLGEEGGSPHIQPFLLFFEKLIRNNDDGDHVFVQTGPRESMTALTVERKQTSFLRNPWSWRRRAFPLVVVCSALARDLLSRICIQRDHDQVDFPEVEIFGCACCFISQATSQIFCWGAGGKSKGYRYYCRLFVPCRSDRTNLCLVLIL